LTSRIRILKKISGRLQVREPESSNIQLGVSSQEVKEYNVNYADLKYLKKKEKYPKNYYSSIL